MLFNANRALKKAKQGGRGRIEAFSTALALANVANVANVANYEIATELHQVMVKNQLVLNYKPVINLLSTCCAVSKHSYTGSIRNMGCWV